jgi:ATP-dependent RNA helicase DBP3
MKATRNLYEDDRTDKANVDSFDNNKKRTVDDESGQSEEEIRKIERKKRKKEKKRLALLNQAAEHLDEDMKPINEDEKSIPELNDSVQPDEVAVKKSKKAKKSKSSKTPLEIEQFRSEHSIQFFPEEESLNFPPTTDFQELFPLLENSCPNVIEYISKKNFTSPSPIQAQCWPALLAGRDAIGIASTGSGKTLAFLVPALLKLSQMGPHRTHLKSAMHHPIPTPRVLIIAPTRELAVQSHEVAVEIGGPASVCIYGGVPKHTQKQQLQTADIVVATPGRLWDLMEEHALSLSSVCYLVLDEADRMLDEGFEPIIRKIVSYCPPVSQRQTVMFSATWPEEIRALANTFLTSNVIRIVVGSTDLAANHKVTQIVECLEPHEKNKRLFQLLETYHKSRTNRCLIFVLYKKEAVTLLTTLQSKGYNVTAIHGDRNQYDRSAALESFKTGETPLLIATDVAARGLDIPQVEFVINYSFPLTVEDYVHRIGRTGRGGASGVSHTFFCDVDKSLAGALVSVLKEANQEIPNDIYKYSMVTKKKQSKLYGDFGPKAELAGKKATKIVFD